ncbi:Abi-alpha family protein [Dickeya oryzae]|uniref:Abi-alpha family protein n=1 Tax=Dickeya oryzae TaxID=1240404 RepID=UPI001FED6401|nr:Abi-alpha family protein [Dickeya oryzae]
MKRTEELSAEYGLELPSRAVPIKIAIPIFQAASMEEDDYLQDKWASLLINASNADLKQEIKRVHISILENLSAMDVRVLDKIYSVPVKEGHVITVVTTELPEDAFLSEDRVYEKKLSNEIVLSLSNLTRLGCIEPLMTAGAGHYFYEVLTTALGRDFMDACQLKHQEKNVV